MKLPASMNLLAMACSLAAAMPVLGQTTPLKMTHETIPGPESPEAGPEWLAQMRQWRADKLAQMEYHGAEYERPELKWTQSSFIQPQMMVEDRYFYDPIAGHYTVDRYLDDLEKRYGGIDSVLIWAVYPNIGIDNRNQFDMVRALPGGLPAVRRMVAEFHRRGVKVLFPMMPWDTGTREEGAPLWNAIAAELKAVNADGANGDTMTGVPRKYREASDLTGHILAFEPEGGLGNEVELPWVNLTWGYWRYDFVPAVSKYKWLEPRHMVNICDRWARNHTDDLQSAFFNGVGFESWENIWGIWNEMTPRDAEICRRIRKIDLQFADLLVSAGWEPHTPASLQSGLYASRFPGNGQTLWTMVNRNEFNVSGQLLRVPHQAGRKYYDLWHGVELTPAVKDASATLSFEIEANADGAVLASDAAAPPAGLNKFLREMKALARKPLNGFSRERRFLPQHVVNIPSTKPAARPPAGMVTIAAGEFEFQVRGIEIEGQNEIGVDVQYPWEDSPRRNHRHVLEIKSFHVDRYPVSNADFKKFVDAAHYRPEDDHNFLKDWQHGTYPAGWANKPVTWISLEDARAYAAWAGKRLPHEWEWQYAAQGTDGRTYPWGGHWDAEAVPAPQKGHDLPGPDNVDAHPKGASPSGVMDLTANVWQWTDEYQDEHTRAAILRGGSYYHPQGSGWYFPEAYKLTEHAKLLLMAPAKDRAGTLGFRCVVDAP